MRERAHIRQPSFEAFTKKPEECTDSEIDDFVRLVIEGGQVDSTNLKQTVVSKGSRLAFARDHEHIAGIAAVKKPARHYVLNVFKKADVPSDAVNYGIEIAWCCTAPQFRRQGISRFLIGKLLEEVSGRNYFATTATGNAAIINILTDFGFEKSGRTFNGRTEPIQLLTRRVNPDEKYENGWLVKIRAAASHFTG